MKVEEAISVSAMADATAHTGRSKRFFGMRFSIKTMLLLIVIVAIGFGVLERFDRIRRSVELIKAVGGEIYYEQDYQRLQLTPQQIGNGPTLTASLRDWIRQRLHQCYSDDVTSVGLYRVEVNHKMLECLQNFKNLQSLNLSSGWVTNEHLKHVSRLTHLKELAIVGSQVGDAGLEHLSDLDSLEQLNLSITWVSDAAVSRLSKLKTLKKLNLDAPNFTDAAKERLRWLLPDCEIR